MKSGFVDTTQAAALTSSVAMKLANDKVLVSKIEALKKQMVREKRLLRTEMKHYRTNLEPNVPCRIKFWRAVARLRTLERRLELSKREKRSNRDDFDRGDTLLGLNSSCESVRI